MVTSSEGNCQICHICRSFPSNLSNSSTRRLVEVLRSRAPDIGISREPIHWASRTKSDHKIKFGAFLVRSVETFWKLYVLLVGFERSLLSLMRQDLHVLLATIHMLVPYRPPKMADQAFAANKRSNMFLPNLACHWGLKDIEGYWKILKVKLYIWNYLKPAETQRFFHRFSWWSDHRSVSARGSGSAAAGGTFWGSVGKGGET